MDLNFNSFENMIDLNFCWLWSVVSFELVVGLEFRLAALPCARWIAPMEFWFLFFCPAVPWTYQCHALCYCTVPCSVVALALLYACRISHGPPFLFLVWLPIWWLPLCERGCPCGGCPLGGLRWLPCSQHFFCWANLRSSEAHLSYFF